MDLILQVLFYTTLILTVFCHAEDLSRHHSQEDNRRLRSHYSNPISLLEAAARLTYPITNRVVGKLTGGTKLIPPYYPNLPYLPYNPPFLSRKPSLSGMKENESNAKNSVAALLNYLGVYADSFNWEHSYESSTDESKSGEDISSNKSDDNSSGIEDENASLINNDAVTPELTTTVPFLTETDTKKNYGMSTATPTNNNIDAETKPRSPIVFPSPDNKGVDLITSDSAPPIPVTGAPNNFYIPTWVSNLGNHGSIFLPISSLNPQNPNYFFNGANVPGGIIITLPSPLSPGFSSIPVNGNTPGHIAFPPISNSNPNLIYAIINPNNPNSGTNMPNHAFAPMNYFDNQGQKGLENMFVSTSSPRYYTIPDNGESGGSASVSFGPANGGSEGNTKI